MKTISGKQFVLVTTDRYKKLTIAIPTSKTIALHIASLFLHKWVIPFEIPEYILLDKGTQIISKLFKSLCSFIYTKNLTATAYHLQMSGQSESFNKTIIAQMWHYVTEHQRD